MKEGINQQTGSGVTLVYTTTARQLSFWKCCQGGCVTEQSCPAQMFHWLGARIIQKPMLQPLELAPVAKKPAVGVRVCNSKGYRRLRYAPD